MFLCHLILHNLLFYSYVFGRLIMFPNLGEVPFFVGDILCVSAAHYPLVTRAMCFRGAPYVGHMGASVVTG